MPGSDPPIILGCCWAVKDFKIIILCRPICRQGGLLPGMANKKEKMHLATITILVKDRQKHAADVNRILTENGHLIMARLGVNVQRRCVSNCTAMIAVAVEATAKDISQITKKLNRLYGIVAEACIVL